MSRSKSPNVISKKDTLNKNEGESEHTCSKSEVSHQRPRGNEIIQSTDISPDLSIWINNKADCSTLDNTM